MAHRPISHTAAPVKPWEGEAPAEPSSLLARRLGGSLALPLAFAAALSSWTLGGEAASPWEDPTSALGGRRKAAAMLVAYFERMCEPKPFEVRQGKKFKLRQETLRSDLRRCVGLFWMPKRVPLDVHQSDPIDHGGCTIRRVAYQLWPQVYSSGLLYVPKELPERPAPAVLCPHGHWRDGNAHPEVQRRCLALAKLGYVVFSSTQHHYEDPALGISHQTLMIWNNIRALDLLESLPEVDAKRIGCTGGSGGGLQTQMLVALDDRVKAATIAGLTCDYREIVFPGRAHCRCNHFPDIMRHTDEPELAALGLPTPVQFLTMNDWTRSFEKNNYPTVRRLYEANGLAGHTDCKYWPTGHSYDKPKRERMVWWMEKWLRGKDHGGPVPEPEVKPLPVETLKKLSAKVPADKGFAHISRIVADARGYKPARIANRKEWERYRNRMRSMLGMLLGTPPPHQTLLRAMEKAEARDGLLATRMRVPSEPGIEVPFLMVRDRGAKGKLPTAILCDEEGKRAALERRGPGSARALTRQGWLVVLPDVRFAGELSLRAMAGLTKELATFKACSPLSEGKPESFDSVWERNALLWGRPIPGMAATDLMAVVDYVHSHHGAEPSRIALRARGRLAAAALFAAALDDRVTELDIDLEGRCFAKRDLPLVPFILRHGDVLEWAALLADRQLTLRGVPAEAGDLAWLKGVFEAAGNPHGLKQ